MPEVVIIGGGVYGCGLAWELSQRGAEVCLLEADRVASGASGGPGKRGVRANGRDVRELPLMQLASGIWPTLDQQLGAATGYEQTGHLMLIEREQDRQQGEVRARVQSQLGVPSRMLCREELREKEPFVSERVAAGLYCPQDGIADHTATTQGYAQAARNLGAEIREQTVVTGLERQSGRVTAVFTDKSERITVGRSVLLVSNSGSVPFVREHLDLQLPAWPVLFQVLLTDPIQHVPLNHLIGHAHRRLAMKVVAGDRIMISGGWFGRWNLDARRGDVVPDHVAGNRDEAIAAYPCLAGVSISGAAADRSELISVDGIPIIDHVPGAGNLMVATGWSGHGWAIAPAVCRLLAEWTLSGVRPAPLAPFGLDRFGFA